jgi:hypothetical protein
MKFAGYRKDGNGKSMVSCGLLGCRGPKVRLMVHSLYPEIPYVRGLVEGFSSSIGEGIFSEKTILLDIRPK